MFTAAWGALSPAYKLKLALRQQCNIYFDLVLYPCIAISVKK